MQVQSYNSLGKIGPHYERPEYRPPEQGQPETGPLVRGDRSTLSTRNTDVPIKKAAPVPTGKVGLNLAKELTAVTSGLIMNLPPLSTTREPHSWLRSGLMTPVYA